jgi:hypothetical protein
MKDVIFLGPFHSESKYANIKTPLRFGTMNYLNYSIMLTVAQSTALTILFEPMTDSDYKVHFGRIGRSLIYEDSKWNLLFSFDFSMPDGKKIVVYKAKLTGDQKPIPSDLSEADKSHIELAFERVKKYVVSCGYQI